MAFTARPCTGADVDLLREVHASVRAPTHYDGNYVGWHEPGRGRLALASTAGK
jgi:hypothetical protein